MAIPPHKFSTPTTPAAREAHAARLLRWGYTALGLLMVALGVIGALLPVMPTTIFLILALACFTRASPRLEQRLLQHPRFGPPLRQWREHRAVSRRGKRMACLGMALGFVAMCWGRPPWPVIALVAVVELAVLAYLLRRPEGPSDVVAGDAAGHSQPECATGMRVTGSPPAAIGALSGAATSGGGPSSPTP